MIRLGFTAKKGEELTVSIEDCLLDFEAEERAIKEGEEETVTVKRKRTKRGPKPPIEPGPEAVKDERWAQVNAKAKAMWGKRLGLSELGA